MACRIMGYNEEVQYQSQPLMVNQDLYSNATNVVFHDGSIGECDPMFTTTHVVPMCFRTNHDRHVG